MTFEDSQGEHFIRLQPYYRSIVAPGIRIVGPADTRECRAIWSR